MDADTPVYSFGYWVKRRRKALDLTQRVLAERVGCAVVTLKKIEADERKPSVVMAERLALQLRVPDSLLPQFVGVARGRRPASHLPPLAFAGWAANDRVPEAPGVLIGREAESGLLTDLLLRPDVRLVTVAGPGGIGKTRLALAVAGTLVHRRAVRPDTFPAGILFVDLAATDSPEAILPAIATTTGFEQDGRPGAPPLFDQLAAWLRAREMLLILDNAEQIGGVAKQISALLQHTMGLKLLVTSRQRLDSVWEHIVPLDGLSYPDAGEPDPDSYAAGQLFLARARQRSPNFAAGPDEAATILSLCRILDGTPLALELAAAWAGVLRLETIVTELQHESDLLSSESVDRPARHQQFDTVWESTWERLSEDEQSNYACLSVFRGGFRRQDAEKVAGLTLPALRQLTQQFLVSLERSTGRYRLHELLRQYAARALASSGNEQATRLAHLRRFRELAVVEEQRLHGPGLEEALHWFDTERDNLAAALTFALSQPALTEDATELLAAWSWSWRIRSQVATALGWLARLRDAPGHSRQSWARAAYLTGHFTWMSGDFDAARLWLEESRAAWEQLAQEGVPQARRETAVAIHHLGMTAMRDGQPALALNHFEQSRTIFEDEGEPWWLSFSYSWAPLAHYALGDSAAAEAAMTAYRALSQAIGDRWMDSLTLTMYAETTLAAGNLRLAHELVSEALALQRAFGHTHSQGHSLLVLGQIAQQRGKPDLAAGFYREAGELFESLANRRYLQKVEAHLASIDATESGATDRSADFP